MSCQQFALYCDNLALSSICPLIPMHARFQILPSCICGSHRMQSHIATKIPCHNKNQNQNKSQKKKNPKSWESYKEFQIWSKMISEKLHNELQELRMWENLLSAPFLVSHFVYQV